MHGDNQEIFIDLTIGTTLEEGYVYSDFSQKVNSLLLGLSYAGIDLPVRIRGSQNQVDSFFQALKNEKKYMDSYVNNGLNDSRTLGIRHRLMRAVEKFEKETGLRWPFKN